MKKLVITLIFTLVVLSACAPAAKPAPAAGAADSASGLLVTVGAVKKSFSAADLQALPSTQASFKDVAYKGVTMAELLKALGVKPEEVKAIKGVATDGYSVNYDLSQILKDNVIVAFAKADGSAMAAEDGTFRLVLPDAEGKLNLRMLAELQIIK